MVLGRVGSNAAPGEAKKEEEGAYFYIIYLKWRRTKKVE